MLQLPSAKDDRRQHYLNLNFYQEYVPAHWMLGKFWQIDAQIYDEFENMLPPRYCSCGFRMSERLTRDIAATYLRIGNDYWCGFSDLQDTPADKLAAHIARLHV
ncbi:MAG: hypothetical protein E5V72_01395 [Mesorhizobium sp.]|uniref:hypothetical protein n=1 Tax=Mesorhizobium sp. TaxID=1871066 RepID=UPI000FEA76AC|nr:hypothetical protein [Mesorhizobium sp.]RWH52253.1 MAG: hypothetical protein EOQ82_26510 [Mesorhizobium sp.]RWI69714.1 MAG: hypothetical protein EOR18_21025 [Mesorhizobium sp.]RWI76181.1 MAG: hypothetical protein EOR19_18615 [Mesorhizobium sp.]RWJ33251.1 MAG: hypothetical protein EOR28_11745 [Mesorhizobium sp.]TIQ74081.1 MAG: hypothetical protein E5X40_06845 [Mesorhizobium sp.]